MTRYRLRRVFAGLLAAAALTACSDQQQTAPQPVQPFPGGCPVDSGKALTLVLGARMGSPRPDLTEVRALIEGAARNNQKVQVIRVDGQPTVALAIDVKISGNNATQEDKRVGNAVKQVMDFAGQQLGPKQPEADVLGALAEAARVTPDGGTIVLVDSGIATAGSLSFQDNGMFRVEPADEAGYLSARHLLPKLDGRSVLLVGLGSTAEPQPALDENFRGRVVNLWQAVVSKAGAACVKAMDIASRRDPFKTSVPVTVVQLPSEPPIKPCGTTVLADSDSVGFVPETANLRDPAAADHTLQQLAAQVSGGTQRITLVGNTASVGPASGMRELSQRRAETIKGALVRLGVSADRITARGDGNTGKYHEQDLDANGVLMPLPAARNRSVVVELLCAKG
ncbi:OmpA family protein [Actinocrispum wychmicini]|uniref:OmpA family protein n=1 Tax=Actinocrispum wychmicini TaxID=1213861 RepID=A0A4R2J8E8_9PSEU|nr:OmpA family protein [Actinocrispum wychmicini]TCO52916.1 OmpA family protein [Actinocrispum wychmicini]